MEKRGDIILAPPRRGTCRECATPHGPREPHNRDSLYYQMKFRQKHGRTPSWTDAIAHLDEADREKWKAILEKQGAAF